MTWKANIAGYEKGSKVGFTNVTLSDDIEGEDYDICLDLINIAVTASMELYGFKTNAVVIAIIKKEGN